MTLTERFQKLSPMMKWQFNLRAEERARTIPHLAYDSLTGLITDDNPLNDLMTDVEKASFFVQSFLTDSKTSEQMYTDLFEIDYKTMGLLSPLLGALNTGDEIVYRYCYLLKSKNYSLDGMEVQHPSLIQDEKEFSKWLNLKLSPSLADFNLKQEKYTSPYFEWVKGSGAKFEECRQRYTKALNRISNIFLQRPVPIRHDNITSNGLTLIRTFSRE